MEEQTQKAASTAEKVENDTPRLLRECSAGIRMGVDALDQILPKVESPKLRTLLQEVKADHTALEKQVQQELKQGGWEDKAPSGMAQSMARLKTNFKLLADHSDNTVADLLTDGGHMGIKSLSRYRNQYVNAAPQARSLAADVIALEERMTQSLREYL